MKQILDTGTSELWCRKRHVGCFLLTDDQLESLSELSVYTHFISLSPSVSTTVIKWSPFLSEHHAMKTYGEVEVYSTLSLLRQ